MELRRRSSTPQDAASRAPHFGNSLRIAPRETSGTEGSNASSSSGESGANLTSPPGSTTGRIAGNSNVLQRAALNHDLAIHSAHSFWTVQKDTARFALRD